eukprot:symbB.v1.2.015462.t1/scaffold1157.1/size134867/2
MASPLEPGRVAPRWQRTAAGYGPVVVPNRAFSTGTTPESAEEGHPYSIAAPQRGAPPRGAGIIAFREDRVCLVESKNGKLSFPKGGKKKSDKSVLECAYRELLEETSIDKHRVTLYPGLHVDEEKFGCRYLIAEVTASETDLDFQISKSWVSQHEDPEDQDPVLAAHWASLAEVLGGLWPGLHPARVEMLRLALAKRPQQTPLKNGGTFSHWRWLLVSGSALGEQPMQLQYSRAFGAKDLKIFGLSCVPDVKIIRMGSSTYKNVRFLVLASDGLWDVISTAEAARKLQEAQAKREHPAEALVQAALHQQARLGGRADNITAVTVQFDQ